MTTTTLARWQHVGRLKPIRVIVVHCTVSAEQGNGAEAVANYFATSDRPGSTHLVSDSDSTVRCVLDANTAYGAAGVNADGLHIELVGMPDQTAEEWLDPYSRAELAEAGPHIEAWSNTYDVPLRWLTVAEVADGVSRGLCTHADASAAFPLVSTGHWDPGPNFPKAEALAIWTAHHAPAPTPEPEQTLVSFFHCTFSNRYYRVAGTHVKRIEDEAKVWELAVGGAVFLKVKTLACWQVITDFT